MDVRHDEMTTGVDRLNGVLGWWGVQGNRAIEGRLERFQQLSHGLHKAYYEANRNQMDVINATNDRVSHSVQGLIRSRTPDQLFVAEAEILTAFMEAASIHMKTWSELCQKIQGCYTDAARETASDVGNQAREVASTVQEVASAVEETAQGERRRGQRATKEAV
jgi:hypothetical protein